MINHVVNKQQMLNIRDELYNDLSTGDIDAPKLQGFGEENVAKHKFERPGTGSFGAGDSG